MTFFPCANTGIPSQASANGGGYDHRFASRRSRSRRPSVSIVRGRGKGDSERHSHETTVSRWRDGQRVPGGETGHATDGDTASRRRDDQHKRGNGGRKYQVTVSTAGDRQTAGECRVLAHLDTKLCISGEGTPASAAELCHEFCWPSNLI